MNTNIGISENNRQAVANELAKILADEYVVYTKTRNAHWNVEGSNFYEKHKFFEDQYNQLDEIIDRIAERIRSIGYLVPATLKSFLSASQLSESDSVKTGSEHLIHELLLDHEAIIKTLRLNISKFENAYDDLGTSDFITGLMQDHEKMGWLLRAHL